MYTTSRNWGMFIAGICITIIGIIMLFFPGITMVTASIVFGVLLCAIGIIDLIFYASNSYQPGMTGWGVAVGIIDLCLGVLFLFDPLIAMWALPLIGGIYLFCYGVFQLVAATQLTEMGGSGWLVFSGISAIVCAIIFFFAPMTFAFFLAIYLICRGISMMGGGLTADSGDYTSTHYPYGV